MTAALAGMGITIGVLALAILFMALRMATLKTDAADADNKRESSEAQLLKTAHELKTTIERDRAHFIALRRTIKELENDLLASTGPGQRRRMLERLLSQADQHPGNNDRTGMPRGGGAGPHPAIQPGDG